MWRVWFYFDIRRALVALHVGLAVLAFTIHFILLSTRRTRTSSGSYRIVGSSGGGIVPA
jgi:hypothetical protein